MFRRSSVPPTPSSHSPKKFFRRKHSTPNSPVSAPPPGGNTTASPDPARRLSNSHSLSRSQGGSHNQHQHRQNSAANATQNMTNPGTPPRARMLTTHKAASSDALLASSVVGGGSGSSLRDSHEPFPTPSEASSLSTHNQSPLGSPRTSAAGYIRSLAQESGGGDTLLATPKVESRPASLSNPKRLSRMHETPPVSSSTALLSSISAPNAGMIVHTTIS